MLAEEDIAALQRKVRGSDAITFLCKERINDVLRVSNGDIDVDDFVKLQREHPEVPSVAASSVYALAIQLTKLKTMNMNHKISSLDRLILSVSAKNDHTKVEVIEAREKLEKTKKVIATRSDQIQKEYTEANERICELLEDLRTFKIKQIQLHSFKLRLQHLKTLKELTFSMQKELLVFSQPIIPLSKLFNANILQINQFLENMILLQARLRDIFDTKLPFLDELLHLIPGNEFFDLIREKEIRLGRYTEDFKDVFKEELVSSPENHEKIIKLGNLIKLPLSSKTLNNQRRASLVKPNNQIEPLISPRSENPPEIPTPQTNNQRKIVIIPHKILSKPFNKLSIKEFLRFLLVVVKILVNFKVFFLSNHQDDYDPEAFYDFDQILHSLYFLTIKNVSATVVYADDNIKLMMEQVYRRLIQDDMQVPSSLKDLNVSSLIENQLKLKLTEWDVVSKSS